MAKTDKRQRSASRPTSEIPASVTIVNESTQLLQKQSTARSIPPPDYKVITLSDDPATFKNEVNGLLLLGLSALAFTFSAFAVKQCGSRLPSYEIVFARSFVQLVLALASCAFLRVNPFGSKPGIRLWLVVRGFVGSLGLILFFYSLTKLTLFEAIVMFFLGPAFTSVLMSILFNDAFTVFDGFCSILCTVGVILISQPRHLFGKVRDDDSSTSKDMQRTFAIICALAGAFMSAAAYVAVRKVGKGTHFMVHVFYVGFIASLISPIGLFTVQRFVQPEDHTMNDWMYLALVGVLAFFGQCLLNQGLKLAPAGPGTLMRMSEVLSAYIVGVIFLREYPDMYTILGAALIVGMTTALGVHRWQQVTARRASAIHRRQARGRLRSHSSAQTR